MSMMGELNLFIGLQIKQTRDDILYQPKRSHQGSTKKIWDGTSQRSRHTHRDINNDWYG